MIGMEGPLDQFPGSRPRSRILLCATGLAPQVVTETLYALHRRLDPPFHPDRLILVSTTAGLEVLRRQLLEEPAGALLRFRRDWAEAAAPDPELVSLEGIRGPLPDIRTSEEAAMAADQIMNLIRGLTEDENAILHVSIAGGRKTMGALFAMAMGLYGREDDELSHVLVSPPYESRADFFYPAPGDAQAERALTLARIPFVRLRAHLPERLLREQLPLSELVQQVQKGLSEPSLEIDLARARLRMDGLTVSLSLGEMAVYVWLAQRQKKGMPPLTARIAKVKEFLEIYESLANARGGPSHVDRVRQSLRHGFDPAYLSEKKSRINRRLRLQLGPRAIPFLVITVGRRPETALTLALPPSHIRIRG